MNKAVQAELGQRLWLARLVVALALVSTLFIAHRLFLEHPLFGAIPAFAGAPSWSSPLDLIALLVIGAAALACLHPRAGVAALVCALLLALRCVPDRITWQPYLLHYGFALGVLGWTARRHGQGAERSLSALRLCAVGIYLWSGLSKFNASFLENGMLQLMSPVLPESWLPGAQGLAIIVPISEVAFAVGLLIPRTRLAAIVLAELTHVSILLMIGPLGLDYNQVVWPWNLAMMALVPILFLERGVLTKVEPEPALSGLAPKLALLLFWVCPGLARVGLWNDYLAFKLYTVQVELGTIYLAPELGGALPAATREHIQIQPMETSIDGQTYVFGGFLSVPWWSEAELGAFAPPHEVTYRHVYARVCARATDERHALLVIDSVPDWITGKKSVRYVRAADL